MRVLTRRDPKTSLKQQVSIKLLDMDKEDQASLLEEELLDDLSNLEIQWIHISVCVLTSDLCL